MSHPNPTGKGGFKPGVTTNPRGRPIGAKGKPRSKLRKTLDRLREIEPEALKNVSDSVNGVDVDKEVLASSKWTISTLVMVQKACLAEEEFKKTLEDDDEDNAPSVEPEVARPKFSLSIVTPT